MGTKRTAHCWGNTIRSVLLCRLLDDAKCALLLTRTGDFLHRAVATATAYTVKAVQVFLPEHKLLI